MCRIVKGVGYAPESNRNPSWDVGKADTGTSWSKGFYLTTPFIRAGRPD